MYIHMLIVGLAFFVRFVNGIGAGLVVRSNDAVMGTRLLMLYVCLYSRIALEGNATDIAYTCTYI